MSSSHELVGRRGLVVLVAILTAVAAGVTSLAGARPAVVFAHVIDTDCTAVGAGIDIRGELEGTTDEAAVAQVGDVIDYTVTVSLTDAQCPISDGVVELTLPDGSLVVLDEDLMLASGESVQYVDAASYTVAADDVGANSSTGAPDGSVRALTTLEAISHRASGIDQEVTASANFDTLIVEPLMITKTANPTFVREFEWDITKDVEPDHWNLFDGDTGTSRYTVSVSKSEPTDSDFAVSGTITIENPNDIPVDIEAVVDELEGVGAVVVTCEETLPYSLGAGATLECAYTSDLPDAAARLNTATVEAGYALGGTATAEIDFTGVEPAEVVNDEVVITDTNDAFGGEQSASESTTFEYEATFDCEGVEFEDGFGSYVHENTASIVETQQSATASVAVNCYQLNVAKTISGSQDIDYDWTVVKTAEPTSVTVGKGESADVTWAVTVDLEETRTSEVAISGEITITNPNPDREAVINSVTDEISGLTVTVDCGGPAPYTIDPASSLVCSYEASGESAGAFENTATAVQQNFDFDTAGVAAPSGTTSYSGMATLAEGDIETTATDACATVVDMELALNESVCADDELPAVFEGTTTYGPEGLVCGENTVVNTATVSEVDSGDSSESTATSLITVECAFEGCTPGYWKQSQHFDSWIGYSPEDLFEQVFRVDVTIRSGGKTTLDSPTLLEALDANGGGINALVRHAVAALLNASNPGVDYEFTADEVIAMTQEAIASGDLEATKDAFASANEAGCPLN